VPPEVVFRALTHKLSAFLLRKSPYFSEPVRLAKWARLRAKMPLKVEPSPPRLRLNLSGTVSPDWCRMPLLSIKKEREASTIVTAVSM